MDNLKTNSIFEKRYHCKYDDIVCACEIYSSMFKAADSLNIPYKTFLRISKKLGCFKKTQNGKWQKGNIPKNKILLEEILKGKFPNYNTNHLRIRLIKEGLKKEMCEECKIILWNGKKAPLELHHIDGNNSNHKLENLKILCCNCHAQTMNYSCKN